ncbi:MAG: putative S-adenosylmethionine:tRNA ribosyltransferase-isomerase [Chlorobi bacterium]|nr:putative S-adenosylmethionine:tRNA ribosyltransferase-isomerase [Chlorobiota bacterium]
MIEPAGVLDPAAMRDELHPLDFRLPPELEANAPPEARGLRRDNVRLMISRISDDSMAHGRFGDIASVLDEGDLLLLNTSGTMNAALPARRQDGTPLVVHLSTHRSGRRWVVELREPAERGTRPFGTGRDGERLTLPEGGALTLTAPHARAAALRPPPATADPKRDPAGGIRLWNALLETPAPLDDYLLRNGRPIRYHYVEQAWPPEYYQTVYATDRGSAEMPSAGRAFTPELITALVAKGVQIAPLLLHTGVASLEEHEPPYAEFFRVPAITAEMVNSAKRDGRRIIAVGTTAVRAIETTVDDAGMARAMEGWTDLVITRERPPRAVNGLLTGLHEPRATHLAMLEGLAGERHLRATYREALRVGYLWHEFGDLHLMLP